jgi:hypothetical protein
MLFLDWACNSIALMASLQEKMLADTGIVSGILPSFTEKVGYNVLGNTIKLTSDFYIQGVL